MAEAAAAAGWGASRSGLGRARRRAATEVGLPSTRRMMSVSSLPLRASYLSTPGSLPGKLTCTGECQGGRRDGAQVCLVRENGRIVQNGGSIGSGGAGERVAKRVSPFLIGRCIMALDVDGVVRVTSGKGEGCATPPSLALSSLGTKLQNAAGFCQASKRPTPNATSTLKA